MVEAASTTELAVSEGRVYLDGRVYAAESPTELDLAPHLPSSTKRWIAVIGGGKNTDFNE